jgi:hypothetical protein
MSSQSAIRPIVRSGLPASASAITARVSCTGIESHLRLSNSRLSVSSSTSSRTALRPCHRALELDGGARGYTTDEFLPIVYDTAGVLLESADPNEEPPTFVVQTQEAISWLSRAVVELDQDSAEASTALTDTLARLSTVWVFAEAAGDGGDR